MFVWKRVMGHKNGKREPASRTDILFLFAFLSLFLMQGPWWAAEGSIGTDGRILITHAVPGNTLLDFIPREVNVTWNLEHVKRNLGYPECKGQSVIETLGTNNSYKWQDAGAYTLDPSQRFGKFDENAMNPQESVASRRDYWYLKSDVDRLSKNCSKRLEKAAYTAEARLYTSPTITITDLANKKSCEQIVLKNIESYRAFSYEQVKPETYCYDVPALVQKIEAGGNFEEVMVGRHKAYYTTGREGSNWRRIDVDFDMIGLRIPVADRFWVQIEEGDLSKEQYLEIASQIDLDGLESLQHSGETTIDGSDNNTGGWLGGITEWGRERINDIWHILEGIYQWFLKLLSPDYCQTNADCPQYSKCSPDSGLCVACTDIHCCDNGTIWREGDNTCVSPSKFVGIPKDTPCTAGWPNQQGQKVSINEENYACDLFEVTDYRLVELAQQVATCYETNCQDSKCHGHCRQAMSESGAGDIRDAASFKEFAGLYIIYGFGPEGTYMNGYFKPELNCNLPVASSILNPNCEPKSPGEFYGNVYQLTCKGSVGQPRGWKTDYNMSENSCVLSELPAHVDILSLHTGTCADYSVSATTLLRMVGYSKYDVYSVRAPVHEYNLVRFPGDSNWTVVDTVANAGRPINASWTWKGPLSIIDGNYSHCSYYSDSCSNDAGTFKCPAKNEVYGCQ